MNLKHAWHKVNWPIDQLTESNRQHQDRTIAHFGAVVTCPHCPILKNAAIDSPILFRASYPP